MTRLFAAALIIPSLVACVDGRPIVDNQSCPCAPGWSCDRSSNVCVANAGSGGSGTSGSGGNSGSGGTTGGTSGGATPCDGGAVITCTGGSMVCSLAACPTTGTAGTAGAAGRGGTSGTGASGGASCAATCTTAPGTVLTPTRVEEAYAVLEGRWGLCAGPWGFGAPADVIGVEFGPGSSEPRGSGLTVGGDLYYLVSGPSGPERGSGFDYQLKYDVSASGSLLQLNIHPAPNSGFGGSIRYSACPVELELNLMYQNAGRILVPIGDGSGFGTGTGGTGGTGGKGGTGGSAGASGAGGNSAGGGTGDGMTYPLSFVCTGAGASCPAGQACPEVPRSDTSCGDIPGVLGHPSIPQTSAHPVGCQALLPFGNPYYLDMQVQCVCMAIGGTTGWQCAL